MLKWGLRESVAEATDNSKKVEDTLPISRARTNIPQRHQLVRNSFCLCLRHFPFYSIHQWRMKLNPLSFHASVLSHWVHFISVSGRSGEQRLLWDCQSLSVYCTSVSNTAARNSDGTEVTLSVPFISSFCPAASFLHLLYFIIPLLPLIHLFSAFNMDCTFMELSLSLSLL